MAAALAKTFPLHQVECEHCQGRFAVPAGYSMLICPPTTQGLDVQFPKDIPRGELSKMPPHIKAAVEQGHTRRKTLARQLATRGHGGACDEQLADAIAPDVHKNHFAGDDRGHWVQVDPIVEG